jgi:hypothetical protein
MDALLGRRVHVEGGDRPFGALTRQQVEARALELKEATGWGPMMRVAPVARAWGELARRMREAGAATVAEMDADILAELAEPLWIAPPL